jgi:hypothetical protein
MLVNDIQRTVAIDRETTFGEGIADFDDLSENGHLIHVFDLELGELRQAVIENMNLKQRAGATRPHVHALKSAGTIAFKFYAQGATTNAAEGDEAEELGGYDEILANALGGSYRGFAAGLAGGTAAAPEVETGELATQADHSWGFFYDASAATGYFRKIASVATDTITPVTGHDLPFTPDGGGADTMHGVKQFYPDFDALEDHAHANHFTHTMFCKGRHAEDSQEPRGVKFGANLGAIEAGTMTAWEIAGKAATFLDPEDISQYDLAGSVEGTFGPVTGAGARTLCQLAAVGAALAEVTFWGSITPTLGIEPDPVMGPNGNEGVHGFGVTEGSYDATGVELTVPYDDDWYTAFRAQTRYHLLVQVGTTPSKSNALYFPRLAFSEEPQKVAVNGRAGMTLRFRALEVNSESQVIDVSGLSAAVAHRALAKFEWVYVG